MRLILYATMLLITTSITAQNKNKFKIYFMQKSEVINISNNEVSLKPEEFDVVFEMTNPIGILVNASLSNESYNQASTENHFKKIKGFEGTGMAEGMFNLNEEIVLSDDSPGYWYYTNSTDNRFGKAMVRLDSVFCVRTINYFSYADSGDKIDISKIKKPLYMVFISSKWNEDFSQQTEYQREYVRINWTLPKVDKRIKKNKLYKIKRKKCISGNCKNGLGQYQYANGDIYTGKFKKKYPNGKGVLKYKNGFVYEGEFINGFCQGNGKLVFNGNIFEGEFEKGKIKKGKAKLLNGSTYQGDFLNGKFDGKGTFINKDHTYKGNFKDGKYSGYGVIKYSNGDSYKGYFKNNEYYGTGRLTFENEFSYSGDFMNNKYHGYGSYHFPSGDTYNGPFLFGVPSDVGTYATKEGDLIKGHIVNNEFIPINR